MEQQQQVQQLLGRLVRDIETVRTNLNVSLSTTSTTNNISTTRSTVTTQTQSNNRIPTASTITTQTQSTIRVPSDVESNMRYVYICITNVIITYLSIPFIFTPLNFHSQICAPLKGSYKHLLIFVHLQKKILSVIVKFSKSVLRYL